MAARRSQRGSILGVVSLIMAAVIGISMIGFTFHSLAFQFGRTQNEADAVAVELAGNINADDRVGQMNELEECSRELVYISSQQSDLCKESEFSFLESLSTRLENQARAGHALLECERKNQIHLITKAINDAACTYNSRSDNGINLCLPWLKTGTPAIDRVDVGYIRNVESNVKNFDAIEELSDFDRRSGYLDTATNLYRSNLCASLPGGGNNLSFYMSPLPAYVDNTCSPARNTNPEVFIKTDTVFYNGEAPPDSVTQIPSAVRVYYSLHVSCGAKKAFEGDLSLTSTAATNGALAGSN